MSLKLNSLNPFDRGFFGKSLLQQHAELIKNSGKISKSTKPEMSSADELNKYFDSLMFNNNIRKQSNTCDTFAKSQAESFDLVRDDIFLF